MTTEREKMLPNKGLELTNLIAAQSVLRALCLHSVFAA